MNGSRIRQNLPAIADIFARHAATAMILWFDAPSDNEIDGDESEPRRARGAAWVAEVQARCQRLMLDALESAELQELLGAAEESLFDPDDGETAEPA